ncbi:hypothetical protein [Aphanothece sacrum]|uniref:hypothetical protein n=1 Tax=Aphanothece sacrum TaxID=1122 RepID=UPI000F615B73|nr:hypothetical protein [Aphanothece sacrum]
MGFINFIYNPNNCAIAGKILLHSSINFVAVGTARTILLSAFAELFANFFRLLSSTFKITI